MQHLDDQHLKQYFRREGTVARWWNPAHGLYRYHFLNQFRILEDAGLPGTAVRVLDAGAGRGMFSVWYAQRGCHVDAVDISAEMLVLARENAAEAGVAGQIAFHHGDVENLSAFDAAGYDLVSCMQTFDHMPDLDLGVRELAARLKPGGRLVFTYVPPASIYGLFYGAYSRWGSRLRRLNDEQGLVARMYPNRHIAALMAQHGLVLEMRCGIGLVCILLRPEFERGLLTAIPRAVNRLEERIFPFYRRGLLALHCTHVVGVARKPDSGEKP